MKKRVLGLLFRFGHWLIQVIGTVWLNACTPLAEPPSAGYEYQPLEKGNYWIYEVKEQRFLLNGSSISETYQLRERITHTYPPTEGTVGSVTYRIERHRRLNNTHDWQPDSASSIRIVDDQLVKTENNQSFVKLVFPVVERSQWNGNAFNRIGEDWYLVRNVGKAFSLPDQLFDETATVVQQNDSTLVSQDKRLEVYARWVGLIYQEKVQLQFCSTTPSCIGKAQIDYGIRSYRRLLAYGK